MGVSHNIFDVSSYGEVRLNNFATASKEKYKQPVANNHSVSYVQMADDSMAFDVKKKNSLAVAADQVIPEENGDAMSQMTGNFDVSHDQKVNGSHYMDNMGSPTSQGG